MTDVSFLVPLPMRLKSFLAPTHAEALRLVREALGVDAIIVATREDEGGGVRITAAIDETPMPVEEPALATLDQDEPDRIGTLATTLLQHQVTNTLAERLLATATQAGLEDAVMALGAAFDAHLAFQPIIADKQDKPLILVGPPGAGKTLAVAKLATRAVLAKKPVAVISADTERAGGMAQLAAFTRLLKRDLIEIEDAHGLKDAIALQPPGSLIVIDTAGCNPFDRGEATTLQTLIKAAQDEAVLVLPAGMDASEAIDMAAAFRALGASRLMITRCDMARRLGSVLRLAFESRLPLANFSATAKVTEAPQPLNPIALARMVLDTPKAKEDMP